MPTSRIEQTLNWIEQDRGVRVLYAAESGSRAWGFPSPDSDYDVRFLYVRPPESYLSIANAPDTLDLPIDDLLDVNGWDLRKALGLFRKSNAPLYEWLLSPIVYRRDPRLTDALALLMPGYFSPRAGCHHYLSMASNAFAGHLQGERVRLKKYFYALRPLLAAQWIVDGKGVPPMAFAPLKSTLPEVDIQQAVGELLELKRISGEKTEIAPVPVLQAFIGERLAALKEAGAVLEPHVGAEEPLNQLFRSFVLG